MKNRLLIFDAGPIISLTMNNLLWLIEPLQKQFRGGFFITEAVHHELVDRPFRTKRYKFEALQLQQYVNSGVIKIIDDEKMHYKALELIETANKCFAAKGRPINIVHYAEMSTLAAALLNNAEAVAIDERTTRELIERPEQIPKYMARRLHTNVISDNARLKSIKAALKGIKVIRSVELVTVAYELGLLDRYIKGERQLKNPKEELLDSVLWGMKLDGCAVSKKEIGQIIKMER